MSALLVPPIRPPAPPVQRRPRSRGVVMLPVGVVVGVVAAVVTASTVPPSAAAHDGALFLHLASLVLGFGSVLAVDWVAAGWVLGRRPFVDVLAAARNAHAPIWVGYCGLVVSGVLLEPDLGSPWTLVKLALVLVIGWNGLIAGGLHDRLDAAAPEPPRGGLLVLCLTTAWTSQACWWGATTIGFLNAR